MTIELGGITELVYAIAALVAAVSAAASALLARRVGQTVGTSATDQRTVHEALEHQDRALEHQDERLERLENGHGDSDGGRPTRGFGPH